MKKAFALLPLALFVVVGCDPAPKSDASRDATSKVVAGTSDKGTTTGEAKSVTDSGTETGTTAAGTPKTTDASKPGDKSTTASTDTKPAIADLPASLKHEGYDY